MALLFSPARSPGPLCPAMFVYRSFSPAVKIHENVGVPWLFSSCLLPRLCSPTWGWQGDGRHPLHSGESPPLPPGPVPAEPGSKFKAEVALLSNSVILPARPPSKGTAHSHTPICRASAALCFVVWRLGTGTSPLLTAVRLRFLPLPAALGL